MILHVHILSYIVFMDMEHQAKTCYFAMKNPFAQVGLLEEAPEAHRFT